MCFSEDKSQEGRAVGFGFPYIFQALLTIFLLIFLSGGGVQAAAVAAVQERMQLLSFSSCPWGLSFLDLI